MNAGRTGLMFAKLFKQFNKLDAVSGCTTTKTIECIGFFIDLQAGAFIFVERAIKHVMFIWLQAVMVQDCYNTQACYYIPDFHCLLFIIGTIYPQCGIIK